MGQTALHHAATHGHWGVLKTLLAAEATADAANSGGGTPLVAAAFGNHSDAVTLLLVAGAQLLRLAMLAAAITGDAAILQALIEAGGDPTATALNQGGWTALHVAAAGGHVDAVRLLLASGASPAAQCQQRTSALHVAAIQGHAEVARQLAMSAPATIKQPDAAGCTALHYAAGVGHTNVVRALLSCGADANGVAADGSTALHIATIQVHTQAERSRHRAARSAGCTQF